MTSQDQVSNCFYFSSNMFLNSTREGLIRIEDLDQEIEGEEPFQSRIGSSNFGAKRHGTFAGWIRVMKPVVSY
jgi:hypothetical protein